MFETVTGAEPVHSNNAAHRYAPTPEPAGARTAEEVSAVRFFWAELLLVAAMSIAGNIVHAWINAPEDKKWIAAFVASFPPIALLAATHGVGLLVRAQNKAGLAYWAVVALTAAIAVVAFRLSFDALRELSIQVGGKEHLGWLFPLIIDGAIGQATVALLVLARTDTRDERTAPEPVVHTEPQPVHTPEPVHTVSVREYRSETHSTTSELTAAHHHEALEEAPRTALDTATHREQDNAPRELDRWASVAEQVCSGDPSGRRDPETVAAILRMNHEDGLSHAKIAERFEISKSTVTRTLIAAQRYTTGDEQ